MAPRWPSGWYGPMFEGIWRPITFLTVGSILPFSLFIFVAYPKPALYSFTFAATLSFGLGFLLGWYEFMDTWRHSSKRFDGMSIVDGIEAGLEDAGIKYRRDAVYPSGSKMARDGEWFFLDHGLSIIVKGTDPTDVYVGPVKHRDLEDITQLQNLIDGALAPPHHHRGNE